MSVIEVLFGVFVLGLVVWCVRDEVLDGREAS